MSLERRPVNRAVLRARMVQLLGRQAPREASSPPWALELWGPIASFLGDRSAAALCGCHRALEKLAPAPNELQLVEAPRVALAFSSQRLRQSLRRLHLAAAGLVELELLDFLALEELTVQAPDLETFKASCDSLQSLNFDFEAPQKLRSFHLRRWAKDGEGRSLTLQPEGLWLQDLNVEISGGSVSLDLSDSSLTQLRLKLSAGAAAAAVTSLGRLKQRRLQRLDLDLVEDVDGNEVPNLRGFSHLQELSVRADAMLALPDALELKDLCLEVPSLEHLDLSEWTVYGSLQRLTLATPRLQRLSLPTAGELRSLQLKQAKLSELQVHFKAFETLALPEDSEAPLRCLRLSGCKQMHTRQLAHLLAQLPHLTELQLQNCADVEQLQLSTLELQELQLNLSRAHRLHLLRLVAPQLTLLKMPPMTVTTATPRRVCLTCDRLAQLDLSSLRWSDLLELRLHLPMVSHFVSPARAHPLDPMEPMTGQGAKQNGLCFTLFSQKLSDLDLTGLGSLRRLELELLFWRARVQWPSGGGLGCSSMRLRLPCSEALPRGQSFLQSLLDLDCSHCHALDPALLRHVLRSAPKLQTLDISECLVLNDSAIPPGGSLRRLRCRGVPSAMAPSLRRLAAATVLEELDTELEWWPQVSWWPPELFQLAFWLCRSSLRRTWQRLCPNAYHHALRRLRLPLALGLVGLLRLTWSLNKV